jgi:hypothetical protein
LQARNRPTRRLPDTLQSLSFEQDHRLPFLYAVTCWIGAMLQISERMMQANLSTQQSAPSVGNFMK